MGYMSNFAACQRAYDNQCPDEPEEFECVDCDSLMERNDRDDGWICPECGNTQDDPEPDFWEDAA